MQLVLHGFDLVWLEAGAVATLPVIQKCRQAVLPKGAGPVEEAARATAADVLDLLNRVASGVETDSLVADLGSGI